MEILSYNSLPTCMRVSKDMNLVENAIHDKRVHNIKERYGGIVDVAMFSNDWDTTLFMIRYVSQFEVTSTSDVLRDALFQYKYGITNMIMKNMAPSTSTISTVLYQCVDRDNSRDIILWVKDNTTLGVHDMSRILAYAINERDSDRPSQSCCYIV